MYKLFKHVLNVKQLLMRYFTFMLYKKISKSRVYYTKKHISIWTGHSSSDQ